MNIYGNSVRVNYVQLFMSYRANGHLDANWKRHCHRYRGQ